ncbi:hypothetical protein PMAYCL1PPCAC_05624, partial [Pristionchus mayeri]
RMVALHRFARVLTLLIFARFGMVAVAADDPDDINNDRYLCPSDMTLVGAGQCRGHCAPSASYTPSGLQTAIDYCSKMLNSNVVMIKTAEQQSYWSANGADETSLAIGIVCDESSKKYKWIDGSAIDYKPDKYDQALNGECRSDVWWYLEQTKGWLYKTTGSNYYSTPCCIADLYHPKLNDDGCTDFNDDDEDSVCYQISETFENFSDAQKLCASAGAMVASVHNDHENAYLRRLAVSRGFTEGLMLGATVGIGKSDTFGWIDGSEWDYTNFIPGFPYDGFGDCLVMNTNDASAQWANVDCSLKLPFVCARKPGSVPETSTTCPGPNVKEGDIITSPGYPLDASIPCDFFLKVDVGKTVQMEIILLEANSCCDHVLIYEGTFGGKLIANVTGAFTTKTYTTSLNDMRVSWQPNGGIGVRGLMFKFSGV